MGWVMPNIDQMIQRISGKRLKYFGVLGPTSGYYQAPLPQKVGSLPLSLLALEFMNGYACLWDSKELPHISSKP